MNLGSIALTVLKTVAPTLALALPGPFGAIASTVLHAALGTKTQADAEAALMNASPDQIIALKKAENDFTVQMQQLGITQEQLVFSDVASARAMQTAVRDPTVARLAWLLIGGFLAVSVAELVALIAAPNAVKALPDSAWLLIGNLFGYFGAEAKQAASFYFGSSAGSQAKDATISDLAKSP